MNIERRGKDKPATGLLVDNCVALKTLEKAPLSGR